MKILMTVTKSEMGGAQTYVAHLIRHLKKTHDVMVMAGGRDWLAEQCAELGVQYVENPYYGNSYNPLNAVRAIMLTRRVMQKFQPDIVHANSGGGGFFSRLASLGSKAKVVFTAHGWSFRPGVPLVQKIIGWIAEWTMRWFTHHTICVSEYDHSVGVRSYVMSPDHVSVIHNGTTIPEVSATPGSSENIRIIFAGRYAPPKRQDLVIRAFTQIDRDDVRLVCAGDGVQAPILHQLARQKGVQDRVTFQSYDTQAMSDLYLDSDLLVLISDYEAFPMVIIEALAHGLPVIANNVGGIKESVDEKVGDLLCSRPTPEYIKRAFVELFQDPGVLQQKGREARKRAIAQFSVDRMVKATEDVYHALHHG